jgi:hypothetical protein
MFYLVLWQFLCACDTRKQKAQLPVAALVSYCHLPTKIVREGFILHQYLDLEIIPILLFENQQHEKSNPTHLSITRSPSITAM